MNRGTIEHNTSPVITDNTTQPRWRHACFQLSQYAALATAFFLPLSTTLTDIFFTVAALAYLPAILPTLRPLRRIRNSVAWGLFAAFCIVLLGTTYTHAPVSDAFRILHKYHKLLLGFLLFPVFHDETIRKRALHTLIASLLLSLLITYLVQYRLIPLSGYRHDPLQHAAIFKNHITSNFFMAYLSYALAYFATAPRTHYRWIVVLLYLAASYAVIALSSGRTGYIIFFTLMMLLAWQRWRYKGIAVAAFALFILGGAAYQSQPILQHRIQQTVQTILHHDTHSSTGKRMCYVKNSIKLIQKRPLIGFGTGGFTKAYQNLSPQDATNNPHNEYLHIGVQFGLLGLLLFILMFAHQLRQSSVRSPPFKAFSQAIILSMIVGCLGNSWLMDTSEGHLYIYMLALCFAGD